LAAAQHVPPVQVEPFGQQVCRRTTVVFRLEHRFDQEVLSFY